MFSTPTVARLSVSNSNYSILCLPYSYFVRLDKRRKNFVNIIIF